MLRTTLCTLTALFLSASVLVAADTKGGKVDQPFAATIVKMDVAKHVVIVHSKGPAGKDVEKSLPIKDGIQLPAVQPGSTFTVVMEGGKVIALRPIPVKVAAAKPVTTPQPKPVAKTPASTATANIPAPKTPAKATIARVSHKHNATKAMAKAKLATRWAQARMVRAQAYLTKANHDKLVAQKLEKGKETKFKAAAAHLAQAKATAGKAIHERNQAIQVAKAKAKAARVAQGKLIQAKVATAKAYKAKVLATRLEKAREAAAKAAVKNLSQAKALLTKANQQVAALKTKEVAH